MGADGYRHSPYFHAKKAAQKAVEKAHGKAAKRTARAKLSPEQRVAQLGKVVFWRTKELADIACEHRLPHHVRGYDLTTWGNAIGCNPATLGFAIAADIGEAMARDLRAVSNPKVRAAIGAELRRNLRIVRRPWYYARETKRRRLLAAERRKLHRRTTANPCPTAEALLVAWNARKNSQEAMILLGGMLQDLECYVDNCLRIDADGMVVGRNGGIRGWLKENLPELSPKYKTLMRYKAMAIRLRQATQTQDPFPTADLLKEPRDESVRNILLEGNGTFAALLKAIDSRIDFKAVFRGEARCAAGRGVPRGCGAKKWWIRSRRR